MSMLLSLLSLLLFLPRVVVVLLLLLLPPLTFGVEPRSAHGGKKLDIVTSQQPSLCCCRRPALSA